MSENKNKNNVKGLKILKKTVMWLGLAYIGGAIAYLNSLAISFIMAALQSSELLSKIMTTTFIKGVNELVIPVRILITQIPVAGYLVLFGFVANAVLSRLKFLSEKEKNIYLVFLLLSFFI